MAYFYVPLTAPFFLWLVRRERRRWRRRRERRRRRGVGWLVVGLVQVVSKRTAWYSQTQTPGILWPLRNAIYGIYPHGPIKRITIFGNNFSNLLALRNSRGLDAAVRGQMRRLACR